VCECDISLAKGMCLESHDLFKCWERSKYLINGASCKHRCNVRIIGNCMWQMPSNGTIANALE